MTQLDLLTEAAKKDAILSRMLIHHEQWVSKARHAVRQIAIPGRECTAEGIRLVITPMVGEPTHQNAWGALFRSCAKAGLLRDTGKTAKSTKPGSHARRITVWVFP